MEAIKEYLVCVTASAIVCGVGKKLAGEKGATASIIKLICGLFLCMAVVSPFVDFRIGDLADLTSRFQLDAQAFVAEGENYSQETMASIIKQQTQAYILDKALALGASVTVEVTLRDTMPPVPCGVCITGKISPYAKARLSALLETELGIGEEAQVWRT